MFSSDCGDEAHVRGHPDRSDSPGSEHQVLHQRPGPACRAVLHLQPERGRQAEDGRERPGGRAANLHTNSAAGKSGRELSRLSRLRELNINPLHFLCTFQSQQCVEQQTAISFNHRLMNCFNNSVNVQL